MGLRFVLEDLTDFSTQKQLDYKTSILLQGQGNVDLIYLQRGDRFILVFGMDSLG